MERTIHDNLLLRYSVDRTARTIRLETEYVDSTSRELTDVLFRGVAAYYFANDAFEAGTILFSIEEIDASSLVDRYPSLFESGRANGWPGDWNKSAHAAKLHLKSSGLRGFEIGCSLGLDGLARHCSAQLGPWYFLATPIGALRLASAAQCRAVERRNVRRRSTR